MTNNILDAALNYAKHGVRVFPIRPNEKTPPEGFMWKTSATSNPDTIRKWFGPGGKFEGHNLAGVMGEELRDGRFLCALDLDFSKDAAGHVLKDAAPALKKFCSEKDIPFITETWRQTTPRGGDHIIYSTSRPLGTGVDRLGLAGVDVRAQGGYILLAPSTIDGKSYNATQTIFDGIARMPDELESMLPAPSAARAGRPKGSVSSTDNKIDAKRAEKKALEYLKTAPVAIEGQSGDATTFKVAAALKDLGCDEGLAFDLMAAHWNGRCSPPWSDGELRTKVANAYRYGREPAGSRAPEAVFDKVEAEPGAEERESPLKELNRRYAAVLFNGQDMILDERLNEDGTRSLSFMSTTAFHRFYSNRTIQIGNKPRPLTQEWYGWPGRREYEAVVFAPEQQVAPNTLNLWQGFGVQARRGSWQRMRHHIEQVICNGDPALGTYLLNWIARLIQKPWLPGEVAIVLRGGQGTGKGSLGHAIRRIFGAHGMHVAQPEHLVGKFNSHLKSCCFLFSDESFFAGDPRHIKILKSLVTEPVLTIEMKGVDSYQAPNRLHVIMASNDDFVVPADIEERRFCVVDVSAAKMQSRDYFDALHEETNAGGLEAMLFDMLRWNLDGFDVRKVPKTTALDEQKLMSMGSVDRYIFELLDGDTMPGAFDQDEVWPEDVVQIRKSLFYGEYLARCRDRYRRAERKDAGPFWRLVYKRLGPCQGKRPADGERFVFLPPRAEARRLMNKALNLTVCDAETDIFG
ncbi:MAG: bifunctional DNA primase/polymerase [Alphaproteobacteria bacterium]